MELWHYDFIKSFISNFVMIFSLSRHERKYWLTQLHYGGDNIIISYANFILSNSQCLRALNRSFPFFFDCFYLRMRGNLLTYMKNIHFSSSLKRRTETSRRNTASLDRDNVHVNEKWPVLAQFRVDQPTSAYFKWHTSIIVSPQRILDCSNSHERKCSTRNLDDMLAIWGKCL